MSLAGWAKLCSTFAFHRKIIEAGNEAAGAFARMISFACGNLTDGRISASVALTIAGRADIIDRLVEVTLLDRAEDGYELHDFADYNPSGDEVRARSEVLREKRAEAGRRGAAARWQTDGKLPSPLPSDARQTDSKGDGKRMAPIPIPIPIPDPNPNPRESMSSAVAPLALVPSLKSRGNAKTKAGSGAPDGYADVIATFVAEFEKARHEKPVVDAKTGKAAKMLLAQIPNPVEACNIIRAAFTKPFVANEKPSLLYIAANPNDFIGTAANGKKTGTGQVVPAEGRAWPVPVAEGA